MVEDRGGEGCLSELPCHCMLQYMKQNNTFLLSPVVPVSDQEPDTTSGLPAWHRGAADQGPRLLPQH